MGSIKARIIWGPLNLKFDLNLDTGFYIFKHFLSFCMFGVLLAIRTLFVVNIRFVGDLSIFLDTVT